MRFVAAPETVYDWNRWQPVSIGKMQRTSEWNNEVTHLLLRSRSALAAENLLLRRQLGLFQERKVRPRRPDDSTREIPGLRKEYGSGFRSGTTGLNLFERSAASGEFLLDGLYGCSPDEWFRAFIPGIEESGDARLKILYAEEDAALDCFVVGVPEPALDKIHPPSPLPGKATKPFASPTATSIMPSPFRSPATGATLRITTHAGQKTCSTSSTDSVPSCWTGGEEAGYSRGILIQCNGTAP